MPGGPDPLYVAARGALLDALEAVDAHLDAIVIVGAQAIHSFSELFGTARSPGCKMAARALTPMEPEATTAASAAALAQDLIRLAGLP